MAKIFSLLMFALLVGCSSQPTQVIVTVDAEAGVRAAATQLHLAVSGGGTERFDQVLPQGGFAWGLELALAPLDGDSSRTWEVVASASGAEARAVGGYVEGQTLFVRLVLEDSCRGVVCSAELTCSQGACVDAGGVVVPSGDAGVGSDAGDAGVDLGRDAGERDGGPVDAGETCPAFVPGTWTRTTTSSGCGAGGGTTTTVLPGMTSVADLNYCPSGAASCHRFDTACRSYINGTLPPQSFEREVNIGLDGVIAVGGLIWTPGTCVFSSVWQRTGP